MCEQSRPAEMDRRHHTEVNDSKKRFGNIGRLLCASSRVSNLASATYFLGVWPICTIQAPKDFTGYPWLVRWVGGVMGLDTGAVFKRPVLCPHCNEDYLFTLRAIAYNQELRCHGCGGSIRLSDRVYEPLLSDVRNTLDAIDCAQLVPSFFSALPR